MAPTHLTHSSNGFAFRLLPEADGLGKLLGPMETAIMRMIWQHERRTVKQVHRTLAQQRDVAYPTVMTTMSHLAEKGILHRQRDGLAYVYTAAVSEGEFIDQAVQQVVGALLADYPDQVVARIRAAGYVVAPHPTVPKADC